MTLDIQIRAAADPERYLATDRLVWFQEQLDAPAQRQLCGLGEQLRFAAEIEGTDPATYAGIYGVFPMTLSVPGGPEPRQVSCAGLTWVGVHPDHRRRGVLTTMLRHHFEQVHAEPGTHLSALHASEPSIYDRHGYGLASREVSVTLGRRTTLTAPHLEVAAGRLRTGLATLGDDDLPTRFRDSELRAGAGVVGAIVGDADYFASWCDELPEQLRDKEPGRMLFASHDGVDMGHAVFRRKPKWEHARPSGEIIVRRMAGSPAARLALLRRLVDFDLIGSVRIDGLGVDDELFWWIGGPRGASAVETYDSLWVRLVDVPGALQARRYAAACDVVLEVTDEAAPWNAGNWRIHIDREGVAQVEPGPATADVRLPVQALGAAYLGGTSMVTLLRAGLIRELRPGAVARLSRAMRTDPGPAGAIGF